MARTNYSAEFKAKVVLEAIQGEEEIGAIANKHGINPNMLRNWKKEFIENADRVFSESKQEKEIRRKEASLEKDREKMLQTIGQLTLEREYLQECFRICGRPVPKMYQD